VNRFLSNDRNDENDREIDIICWLSEDIDEPRLGHRGSTLSKKDSCGACARSRGYPFLDLVREPRHSAGSKPYPLGELAGGLQPGYVRGAVRNAIDCFQILLRYELPCHCKSLLLRRDVATPRLALGNAEHTRESVNVQRKHRRVVVTAPWQIKRRELGREERR
jgi:hypothetical protein